MKVYLIGHRGWIGEKYASIFTQQNIDYTYSDLRAESEEIKQAILASKATHVVSCMGRTHGTRDGKTYTTIDYLQDHGRLHENINDNLYAPLSLALFCDRNNIHFTYVGTGCIFTYDEDFIIGGETKFTEDAKPNFFGSNYSVVKGFTDQLIKETKALNLRIRMPITDEIHPRNFITKITTYAKICSVPNSMSVLNDLIPLSIAMMKDRQTGTFNFTNPGAISHNEILTMYKEIVDPDFTWENFTYEEQNQVLLSGRSNNTLCEQKLLSYSDVPEIHTSVRAILMKMKHRKDKEEMANKIILNN